MNRAQLHRDASWLAGSLCLFCALDARAQVTDCSLYLWPGVNMAVRAGWGAIDPSGSVPCREDTSHRSSLRSEFGAEIRIFYPTEWQLSWHPDVPRDIVTWIADAIRDTMRRLQPVLSAPDINVVLLESVAGSAAGDWSWNTAGVVAGAQYRPCPLAIPIVGIVDRSGRRRAGTRSQQDIRETVAHEVYHCYQNEHFRERVDDYVPSASAWWIEGTAVHVANSVYPCNNMSVASSSLYQPTDPLFGQTTSHDQVDGYPNVVFFQHLAEKHRFDLRRLAEFSNTMAPGPGAAPQRRALAAWPGIGEQLHAFARALQDVDILACFQSNLNVMAPFTPIRGSQRVRMTVTPFTAPAHLLTFPPTSQYRIRVQDSSGSSDTGPGDPDRVSYRDSSGGRAVWRRADGARFTVRTQCGQDQPYMFVATSARADLAPFRVDIEVEEVPSLLPPGFGCCVETGQRDECLVGSWQLDKDHMVRQLSRLNPGVTYQRPQGEMSMRYDADGRIVGARTELKVDAVKQTEKGPARFQIGVAGQGDGRWSTGESDKGPVLHTCGSDNAKIDKRIQWPGVPVDTRPPVFGAAAPAGMTFPYSCSGDTLTLKLPGNVMQQVYRRVEP